MKKKTKTILISVGIVLGLIIAGGGSFFLYLKFAYVAKPFDLSNAPQYILDIKDDLSEKLDENTFEWSNMPDFVIFAQYVADNSPDVLEKLKGWEEEVLLNITDRGNLWLSIGNDSLSLDIVTTPPTTYSIYIEITFAVAKEILSAELSTQQAFQSGKLTFEGNLEDVIAVGWLVDTAAATIMGTYVSPYEVSDNIKLRVENTDLFNSQGLTLLPYVAVTIDPYNLGQVHGGIPDIFNSDLLIVNSRGEIVYRLGEGSLNTVQKFLNSTTIISGGKTNGQLELWNFKTGVRVTLPIPAGHHCLDYNPFTQTIMVLEDHKNVNETVEVDGWPLNVIYDDLKEYYLNGTLVWQWNSQDYIPFNYTRYNEFGLNLTFAGGVDWMHSNSFVWDKAEGSIYLNVRNLDTIAKIDYTTKNITWEAGRYSNFTFYDKNDQIVDAIMHSPHGFEKIGKNRFIVFDNDLYNTSNPMTMHLEGALGWSRMVEFEIDEVNRTIKEVWSWTPSNQSYYLPESGGDANRLPNGNTIGVFANKAEVMNLRDPVYLTEVTPNGEVAWELMIDGFNNTYFWIQSFERFYEKPVIEIQSSTLDLESGALDLNLLTWDCFKRDYDTSGTIKIVADEQVIYENTFTFDAFFKSNALNISLTNVPSNAKFLAIVVENQDGVQGVEVLLDKAAQVTKILVGTLVPVLTIGILVGTYFILRKTDKLPKFLKRG